MRKLKYHEQKLLKKVDFLHYPSEKTHQEIKIIGRYMLQKRNKYMEYRRLVASIRKLAKELMSLPADNAFRISLTASLNDNLYDMGLIKNKENLSPAADLTVSSFCRRRFAVICQRLKFVQNLKDATTYIQDGHFRIGPNTVTDPGFIVTRTMEDQINWVNTSKIKRHIDEYHNTVDDYEN